MSFILSSRNRIEVKRIGALEREFIKSVKKYFNEITNYEGLRGYNINKISLKKNDEVLRLGDNREVSDEDFMWLINKIDENEDLLIEADYELEINLEDGVFNHKEYGNAFFKNILNDELRKTVKLYSIDTVDYEEGINTISFDENGLTNGQKEGDINDFKNVNNWYASKFVVNIDNKNAKVNEQENDRILEILKGFRSRNEYSIFEEDEEELFFEGEFVLNFDELVELNKTLSELFEISEKINAVCKVILDLISVNESEFAAITLKDNMVFNTYGPYGFDVIK